MDHNARTHPPGRADRPVYRGRGPRAAVRRLVPGVPAPVPRLLQPGVHPVRRRRGDAPRGSPADPGRSPRAGDRRDHTARGRTAGPPGRLGGPGSGCSRPRPDGHGLFRVHAGGCASEGRPGSGRGPGPHRHPRRWAVRPRTPRHYSAVDRVNEPADSFPVGPLPGRRCLLAGAEHAGDPGPGRGGVGEWIPRAARRGPE